MRILLFGRALNLHLNYKLHPQGLRPLLEFQQHFQRAVADYQQGQQGQQGRPCQPLILELGFFSRPIATVVLGLFAILVG
ncbi:hypothetical protein [Hymenobacter terricola]|uniref:hypothetical protein n=1 Tax=Hymenobacter terricola TaxID=2819236 RepID=UPI001B31691B|nr:hypothetical protein [Hymenobacter terricola]